VREIKERNLGFKERKMRLRFFYRRNVGEDE
jgi:hypothetical protein